MAEKATRECTGSWLAQIFRHAAPIGGSTPSLSAMPFQQSQQSVPEVGSFSADQSIPFQYLPGFCYGEKHEISAINPCATDNSEVLLIIALWKAKASGRYSICQCRRSDATSRVTNSIEALSDRNHRGPASWILVR